MKIREEDIDHLEREPRCHENIRLSLVGSDPALRASRSLERTYDRGSDSDNSPSRLSRLLDGTNRLRSNLDPFCAHLVVFDLIDCHRLEGPDTHMQRDGRETDPPLL